MFTRSGEMCVANLRRTEARVLRLAVVEMVGLLSDGPVRTDPVLERLFPDMYPDDPESSAELRRYTEDDLRAGKLHQASAVLEDLPKSGGTITLTAERADLWLRTLTDVRLALGTRLQVTDDTDIQAELDDAVLRDPTSSLVGDLTVYEYLSILQESLLAALLE